MANEYVRPSALKLPTRSVIPNPNAGYIRPGAGLYKPTNAPIANPNIKPTGFFDSLKGAGKGLFGMGALLSPTELGSGSELDFSAMKKPIVKPIAAAPKPIVASPVVKPVVKRAPVGSPMQNNTPTGLPELPQTLGADPRMANSALNWNGIGQDNQGVVPTITSEQTAQVGSPQVQAQINGQGTGLWDQFSGWANRPQNLSAGEYSALTPDQKIAAGKNQSNLGNLMGNLKTGIDIGSGLAGLYQTYQNNKFEKKKIGMLEGARNSQNANTARFAANAGGSFVPA